MRKLSPVLLFILFHVLKTYGQQNNNWYFGLNAGISFNAGAPTLPYALTNSNMTAFEGSSAVSDVDGNIVLYTNSKSIYNKNHEIILNGDSLLGHVSTFQSSLIVPLPDSDSLFYVFTGDAFENLWQNGYRYSIVDIEGNNGKGVVIAKNILLHAPGTERLTAARHANGVDVWVITNEPNSNIFRAYLITCNGLQTTPVISTVGIVMDQYESMNIGSLKVSPNGKMLCQSHFRDFELFFLTNFFQLFDFDNVTGVISNPRSIITPGSAFNVCEFSPDSKFIYATKPFEAAIDQFDVQIPTLAGIINSRYSIPATVGFYGIQAGPDNKIYVNGIPNKLSVISNPNVKGPGCNFELNKIDLAGRSGGIGFPGVINDLSFDPYNNFNFQVIDSCSGVISFNAKTNLPGALQWEWDFGDGTKSNLQNPVHDYPQSNKLYYVKLKISSLNSCGSIEKGLSIPSSGLYTKTVFDFVSLCDSGYVRFINKSYTYPDRNVEYLWEFGDGSTSTDVNPIHIYSNSGTYDVKLKINSNLLCLNDSASQTLEIGKLTINAVPDSTVIDEGQTIQLDVTGGGDLFFWAPSTWLTDPFIRNPQTQPLKDTSYIVIVKSFAGCIDTDTIHIKVRNVQDIYVPTAFTPNNDGKNDVFRPRMGLLFELDEFSIFNRWGQRIYTTRIRNEGWNGKVRGTPQGPGMYVWILRAKNDKQKVIQQKGTFLLIR
jgi:gliding motility-associated-like protein